MGEEICMIAPVEAVYEIVGVDYPSVVTAGSTFSITVRVHNRGERSTPTCWISIRPRGVVLPAARKDHIYIPPCRVHSESFTLVAPRAEGSYIYDIYAGRVGNAEPDSSRTITFRVVAPTVPAPPPTRPPTAPPTPPTRPAPPRPPAPPAGMGKIYGIVHDHLFKFPLVATVMANGNLDVSGADGRYEITLSPGKYRVVCTAPLYRPAEGEVEISAGESKPISFALEPVVPWWVSISLSLAGIGLVCYLAYEASKK